MGYFSQQNLVQQETEWVELSETKRLADRFCYLRERLNEIEAKRPHDMMDPAFDRWFYSGCAGSTDSDINTIQGVLQAIRETKELMRLEEENERDTLDEQQKEGVWEDGSCENDVLLGEQSDMTDLFCNAKNWMPAA